jgi:hypothetical protein
VSKMGEGPLARFTRVKRPVARDEGLLVERLDDETVIYDTDTHEAHCLTPLAAVIFEHCDGRTTIDELSRLAGERVGEPVDKPLVIEALEQLQERGLLAVPPRDGFSRRDMIRKTAVAAGGVAFGAPLITSIVAPGSVAAASATCGELLCCACCQNANLNKDECCTSTRTFTLNCQCTGNRNTDVPVITNGKYCKPAGSGAPSDAFCDTLYGGTAADRQAHCSFYQSTAAGGAGSVNCCACAQANASCAGSNNA